MILIAYQTFMAIFTPSALLAVIVLGFLGGFFYLPWLNRRYGLTAIARSFLGVAFFLVVGLARIFESPAAVGGFTALSALWCILNACIYAGIHIRRTRFTSPVYPKLHGFRRRKH